MGPLSSSFHSALELYYVDVGAYPRPETGLKALIEKPDGVHSWAGPYLRGDGNLVDSWGHAYVYDQPEGNKPFEIRSLGRDGRPGGEGQDADISG